MELNRKGFYFSFDALVALTLIAAAFFVVTQSNPQTSRNIETRISSALQGDAVAESSMQVAMRQPLKKALNSSRQDHYIRTTHLTEDDLNRSVMDAVAVLWASNDTEAARNLAREYLSKVVPDGYGYSLRVSEDGETVIYNTSRVPTEANFVARSSRVISGVARDKPTRGFIARASLFEATKRATKNVFYGGYVGDGNITSNVTLPDLHTVLNVTFEGDFSGPFDLYFNDRYAGHYVPTAENLSADVFQVCSTERNASVCEALDPGDNLVHVNFTTGNRSIGGGFLSIDYNRTTGLKERGGKYLQRRKKLHGIEGVINLFSSFYVPGSLEEIEAYLHLSMDGSTAFFSIGNETVYSQEIQGEKTVSLSSSEILGNLSYLDKWGLSRSTVPFRVGVTRESLMLQNAREIDAVGVTDVSGSMSRNDKIDKAKNAAKKFIDIVLNATGSRVGLVAFNGQIDSYLNLMQDRERLDSEVESWKAGGETCIGCGIVEGINVLINRKETRDVLSERSEWRYRVGKPGTGAWKNLDYDDSDWDEASAPLGNGGLAYSQLGENDTYLFRKHFNYGSDSLNQVYLSLRQTGNTSVYLNGNQVKTTGSFSGNYWDVHLGRWKEKSGLWHRSTHRSVEGNSSWYFGLEEVYHYSTNRRENGSLTTPWLDLSNISSPELSFRQYRVIEDHPNYDLGYVEINDGTGWTQLREYSASSSGWTSETVDLSSYTSEKVKLRIRFDTVDYKKNGYEGWYIDNVTVGGFESSAINTSILKSGENVLAVRMDTEPRPRVNGSLSPALSEGRFNGTEIEAGDIVLNGTTRGTYTTPAADAGKISEWTALSMDITEPENTSINLSYATNVTGEWKYVNGFSNVSNGRFFRVRAELSSNETGRTPSLNSLGFNYSSYGTSFDAEMTADVARFRSQVVLSDGKSNQETEMQNVEDRDGDGDVDAVDHSIEAACRANNEYGIRVYTVAFGGDASVEELNLTAECGGGKFYDAGVDNLTEVYEKISSDILEASFQAQEIRVLQGEANQTLHPDSYLSFNYTPVDRREPGTFELRQVSDRFGGDVESPKNGSFRVPPGVDPVEAAVTSYSSNYWTDRVLVENSSGWEYVYRLWKYGENYTGIGDPFRIHIPSTEVHGGVNNVSLDTGLNRTDRRGGSPDDRVIYTLAVEGSV
ncbi:MAG: VWA domain-containing protein, partial [Candidatus Nanohaloarchaea archaeon]